MSDGLFADPDSVNSEILRILIQKTRRLAALLADSDSVNSEILL